MDRQVVSTRLAPGAIGPYSQAIRTGNLVFVSGQIPLDPETGELVSGGIDAHTRRVMTNLSAILEAAGTSLDRVARATVFLANLDDFGAMNAVYGEFFQGSYPSRSTVQVAALPRGALVEIDVIALVG